MTRYYVPGGPIAFLDNGTPLRAVMVHSSEHLPTLLGYADEVLGVDPTGQVWRQFVSTYPSRYGNIDRGAWERYTLDAPVQMEAQP